METATKERNHSRLAKRLGIAAAVIVVLAAAVILFASNYLVDYAIGRSGDGGNREVALDVDPAAEGVALTIAENKASQETASEAFLSAHPGEEVTISSPDGLALYGVCYPNDSHRWVIAIHGYRGSHLGATALAQHYHDAGYQVLTPDLRACGDSEGDYVGMGWLDRMDILAWVDWVLARDPEAEIVIHGISMGAATTMMTAGEETPDAVKVFVEDCGYTSVWDVFSSELSLRFGLPEFPLLYTAQAVAQVKAGYSFQEASALEQVALCDKPMLFIHGTLDDFIPFEMLDELYNAKPGDDNLKLVAEGAGHGEAMYALGDAYWDTVFDFADDYLSQPAA